MKRKIYSALVVEVCLLFAVGVYGQTQRPRGNQSSDPSATVSGPVEPDSPTSSSTVAPSSQAVVPRLMKFGGVLHDAVGKPLAGAVDVTFSLYSTEAGGEPLWFETQSVQADELGRYTTLLGAMHTDGLPIDLFTSGEAHWLGIQVGLEAELQPRVLLVSVPYALKAGDAETLGGKPASAYMLSDSQNASTSSSSTASATGTAPAGGSEKNQNTRKAKTSPLVSTCSSVTSGAGGTANALALFTAPCNIENSAIAQSGNNIGIGTTAPLTTLQVHGGTDANIGFDSLLGETRLTLFNDAGTANVPLRLQASTYKFFNGGGAVQALTIDPSGNVGIGTPSPNAQFNVYNTSNNLKARFEDNGAGGSYISLKTDGTGGHDYWFGSTDNSNGFGGGKFILYDTTAAAPRLAMDSSGNVGIGTTAPAHTLDVNGTANFSGLVTFAAGQTVTGNVSTAAQLVSTVATGTAPLSVTSTTQVPNLDASLLGGLSSSAFAKLSGGNSFSGNQAVTGTVTATSFLGSGAGITGIPNSALSTAALTRGITYLAGCDSCMPLGSSDGQPQFYINVVGNMTITSVECFSDNNGSSTINIAKHGGSNLLNSNLTCNGTPTTSFTSSALNLSDQLDFVMAAPDGVAKRITVVVQATLN
jgi:hypothetical protein